MQPERRNFLRGGLAAVPLIGLASAAAAMPALAPRPDLDAMRTRFDAAWRAMCASWDHLGSLPVNHPDFDKADAAHDRVVAEYDAALRPIIALRSTDPLAMNLKACVYAALCGSERAAVSAISFALEDEGPDVEALAASMARDLVEVSLGAGWGNRLPTR